MNATVPHVDTNRSLHATDPAAGDLQMQMGDQNQDVVTNIASKPPADSPPATNWPGSVPHIQPTRPARDITHTKA